MLYVSVHIIQFSKFAYYFSSEIRQLTLFILVRASRTVAVSRLQSVVSPRPAEGNDVHSKFKVHRDVKGCDEMINPNDYKYIVDITTNRSSLSLTSLFSSVSGRFS